MNIINLENKRIYDLIVEKDSLVNEGRKISREIEDVEAKIKVYEEKEKAITAKIVPPKEMTDKGDSLVKEMTKIAEELDKLAKQINKSKLDAIPKDMRDEHKELMKKREALERDRNKVALKVQKIKDKVVPLIQKEVKPILQKERMIQIDIGKYDDIETAKARNGKVCIDTFNHLESFRRKFGK